MNTKIQTYVGSVAFSILLLPAVLLGQGHPYFVPPFAHSANANLYGIDLLNLGGGNQSLTLYSEGWTSGYQAEYANASGSFLSPRNHNVEYVANSMLSNSPSVMNIYAAGSLIVSHSEIPNPNLPDSYYSLDVQTISHAYIDNQAHMKYQTDSWYFEGNVAPGDQLRVQWRFLPTVGGTTLTLIDETYIFENTTHFDMPISGSLLPLTWIFPYQAAWTSQGAGISISAHIVKGRFPDFAQPTGTSYVLIDPGVTTSAIPEPSGILGISLLGTVFLAKRHRCKISAGSGSKK